MRLLLTLPLLGVASCSGFAYLMDCTAQCINCEYSSSCDYTPSYGDACNLDAPSTTRRAGKCIPTQDEGFACVSLERFACSKLTGDPVDAGKECVEGTGTCTANNPVTGAGTKETYCMDELDAVPACAGLAGGDPCTTEENPSEFVSPLGDEGQVMEEVCVDTSGVPVCTPVDEAGCAGMAEGTACTYYRFSFGPKDAFPPSQCAEDASCRAAQGVESQCGSDEKCLTPEAAACVGKDLSDDCSYEDFVRHRFKTRANFRDLGKNYAWVERTTQSGTCKLVGGAPGCDADTASDSTVVFGEKLDESQCDDVTTDSAGVIICTAPDGYVASARIVGVAALAVALLG